MDRYHRRKTKNSLFDFRQTEIKNLTNDFNIRNGEIDKRKLFEDLDNEALNEIVRILQMEQIDRKDRFLTKVCNILNKVPIINNSTLKDDDF